MASSYEILIDSERDYPVLHENRFSEIELFRMFAIDCSTSGNRSESSRTAYDEFRYAFNDVLIPLWSESKRELTRGEREAVQTGDHLLFGVSDGKPGTKERIDDLRNFYDSDLAECEVSPFTDF